MINILILFFFPVEFILVLGEFLDKSFYVLMLLINFLHFWSLKIIVTPVLSRKEFHSCQGIILDPDLVLLSPFLDHLGMRYRLRSLLQNLPCCLLPLSKLNWVKFIFDSIATATRQHTCLTPLKLIRSSKQFSLVMLNDLSFLEHAFWLSLFLLF